MAQFNKEQKSWVDRFLETPGGKGATAAPSRGAPGLGGMDSGQVQSLSAKDLIEPAKEIGKAVKGWVNTKGATTIIIENRSSKDLSLHSDAKLQRLHFPKQAKWGKMAPPRIPAGGKATITVETDKLWRGKTTADTSGEVVFEIAGEKKKIVRVVWVRKGDKMIAQSDSWSTESGKYSLTGHQSNPGEYTFWFEEVAQPAQQTKPATRSPKK
jgi:hypothetical protein